MEFILITNDVTRASIAEQAGVDFIMVDLEINGKVERQGHLNTVISRHTMQDVDRVRRTLRTSRLLVRVNPLFDGSAAEIDRCIELGADAVMLPMFRHPSEVETFVELVRGRARTWLLLETPQALVRCEDILDISGIDAVHVGLNDLHLGLGLDFMFELLSHGIVDWLAGHFNRRGTEFGVGGIARLRGGLLDAGLILSEHVRLGSSRVILSRDFLKVFDLPDSEAIPLLTHEVFALRSEVARLRASSPEKLQENRREVLRLVRQIADARRSSREIQLPISQHAPSQ